MATRSPAAATIIIIPTPEKKFPIIDRTKRASATAMVDLGSIPGRIEL